MSPETTIVWKDGASAETSQLNFPEIVDSTDVRRTWLWFDNGNWMIRGYRNMKDEEDYLIMY